MGAGAGGRHAVPLPGGEVGAGREAGDVRRPRGRHRRLLVGAPRAHLDARPVAGGQGHPRRRRRDRRVVVVDREQHRLEQHRLGERRLDDQHRGVREVGLALGVAPDVAREAVRRQPLARRGVDDVGRAPPAPARRSGTPRSRPAPGRRRRPRRSGAPRAAAGGTARRPTAGARCPSGGRPGASSARSGRSAARCSVLRVHGGPRTGPVCQHGGRVSPRRGRADPHSRRDHPDAPSRG